MEGEMEHNTDGFRVGDRVFDRAQIDGLVTTDTLSLAVVTGSPSTPAKDITVTEDGEDVPLHEYGVNPKYACPSSLVCSVIFTSALDRYAPQWKSVADDPDALASHLRSIKEEYGVPLGDNEYDFPVERLKLSVRP